MTERQVWLKLARDIEGDLGKDLHDVGLCWYLAETSVGDAVHRRVYMAIKNRVSRSRYGVFGWRLSASGHRARIAFCKRQVARIDRERRRER